MREFTFSLIFLSLLNAAAAAEVRFESAAKIKRGASGAFEEVKDGQTIDLKSGESLLALPSRGLPLLIYSPASSSSSIVVSDVDMKEALSAELRPALENATSEIVNGLRKAENFVQRKNYEQARSILAGLKQKYSRVSSVLFLSGTVNYLLNDKATAIEDLQTGLQLDPENEPAKQLLARLKGKS